MTLAEILPFEGISFILFSVPVEDCLVSLFGAATISEDSTFISVCVQLDGPTSNDVFINYNTVPLTATGTKKSS